MSQTFITQVIVLVLSDNISNVYNTSNCVGFVRQYLKRLLHKCLCWFCQAISQTYIRGDSVGYIRQYLLRL